MSKRPLTSSEKQDILMSLIPIHPDPNFIHSSSGELEMDRDNNFVIENVRKQISIQLDHVTIYPELIPQLKEEIIRQYSLSFISPGEMVGCIAATSIGEVQTQESLNSVTGDTEIIFYTSNDKPIQKTIGELVDNCMTSRPTEVKKCMYTGDTEDEQIIKGNLHHKTEYLHRPFVETIDVSAQQWKIASVDEDGKVTLEWIKQLIRHPLYTGLIKVTTQSGRIVKATTGESFLAYRKGKLVPVKGSELTLHDRLGVILCSEDKTIASSLHLYDSLNLTTDDLHHQVVLDPIVSIESLDTTEVVWVYDITVERTLNFVLKNRLAMRDSFHSSGSMKQSLSSGLARFQELINLTHQIKTPSVNFELHSKYGDKLKKSNPDGLRFVREIIHSQILHIRLNELILDIRIEENPRREWWYSVFNLLYSDAHKSCTHRLRLQLDRNKIFKCKKDMAWIAGKIEKAAKLKGMMHIAFSDNFTAQLDVWIDPVNLSDCDEILQKKDIDPEDIDKMSRYINEHNKAEICLRNVVLPLIKQTTISGLVGVTACYTDDHNDIKQSTYLCDTRGGSLRDILGLDCIDPTKCNSNNPWEIYEIFGVEAAFQFLVQEFKKVSDKVSRRHLDVMVEWMCTSGKLSSVNRYGQDISKIGPMAKASFEKPLEAFVKAASSAQTEVITGVSASISTGNLARIGTGSFQMMLDMQKLMSSTPIEEEKKLIISEEQDMEEDFEDVFTGTDEQPDEFTYQMGDDDDGLI